MKKPPKSSSHKASKSGQRSEHKSAYKPDQARTDKPRFDKPRPDKPKSEHYKAEKSREHSFEVREERAPRAEAPKSLSEFESGEFQRIYGKHPVREALTSGRPVYKLLLAQNLTPAVAREFEQLARKNNVPVQQVPHAKLSQLLSHLDNPNHQGIVAETGVYDYADWDEWLTKLQGLKEQNIDPFVLVLDQIQDPHNLGAIIRTAEAAGVHGVVIPKNGAVGLSETVAKSSAGAIEVVPVLQVTNLARALEELKEAGLWIMGLSANDGQNYFKVNLKGPIALVIGNEQKGLRQNSEKHCDQLLLIPMQSTRSLNASVAAAVAMYEVVRQRQV